MVDWRSGERRRGALPRPRPATPTITIVVDVDEPLPTPPDSPVRHLRAINSGAVVLGNDNRIDHEVRFRIKRVEVNSADFWDVIPARAREALAALRADPADEAANQRFRDALPQTDVTVVPSRTDLSAEPGVPVDLDGHTGQLLRGDHNHLSSRTDHVIARGRLPLHDLLRDSADLVTAFAGALDNPADRDAFTRGLTDAVKTCDVTDIDWDRGLKGPVANVADGVLETDRAGIVALGWDNDVTQTHSTTVRRVVRHPASRLDDIARKLPPPPLPPPPEDPLEPPEPPAWPRNPFRGPGGL